MDVAMLIKAVRERKPLWDRKHAYYHDRVVTMGMWAEVAMIVAIDPDTARAKWKGLRDTFRGELRKVNKFIASGATSKSTNWEYFDEMLFVKDQIYSNKRSLAEMLRKTSTNSPTPEEENGNDVPTMLYSTETVQAEEEIKSIKCERIESPLPSPTTQVASPVHFTNFTPATNPLAVANAVPTINIVHGSTQLSPTNTEYKQQKQNHLITTDDDYNFLMSILPQLRSLPTMRNLFVRLKIQELLYNEIITLREKN